MAFFLSFAFWACDTIKEEDIKQNKRIVGGNTKPDDGGDDVVVKTVVLEDFTGVRCVNCPKAAEVAHTLKTLYGEQLILIEMHPASLKSLTRPAASGDADLSCDEASEYAAEWAISSLPQGLVSRKQASGKYMAPELWSGAVAEAMAEEPIVGIKGSAKKEAASIKVDISANFVLDYKEAVNVLCFVLEDGFSVTQKSGEGDLKDYKHNHVFRKRIESDKWGVSLLSSATKGETATYSASVDIDAAWNVDNLNVVVLLCSASTHEILQAKNIKVE